MKKTCCSVESRPLKNCSESNDQRIEELSKQDSVLLTEIVSNLREQPRSRSPFSTVESRASERQYGRLPKFQPGHSYRTDLAVEVADTLESLGEHQDRINRIQGTTAPTFPHLKSFQYGWQESKQNQADKCDTRLSERSGPKPACGNSEHYSCGEHDETDITEKSRCFLRKSR